MWYIKKKNHLLCIVRKNQTPLYIYDKQTLINEINKYIKTFLGYNVKFYYAFKANSNTNICKVIKQHRFGADVVSGGELDLALKLGFKNIVFSGVGKSRQELEKAIINKIDFINIESFEEFEEISKVSKRLKIKTNISVRVNPNVEAGGHNYIKTAKKYSKFGVDFNTAFEIYKKASCEKYLNIKAIHFHLGSQIFSEKPYKIALEKVILFLENLKKHKIEINTIDIGGGWGVKEGEESKNHIKLLNVIKPYIKEYNFILEPGRSIVSSCGILLTRVLYRKKVDDRYIVIVDAGMNNLIRPALYNAFHPIINFCERKGNKINIDIAGPICETSDFFIRDYKMVLPQQNDILVISSCGAYAFSMASNYNLRGFAGEIFI
ncbi:MAG: diaminopimelate decarboxylase [Elusimicrobiota bacterium]